MTTAKIEHNGFLSRIKSFVRNSALWLGAVGFAALAALAAFFFAIAAVIGALIIAGTLALIWLIFRITGSRRTRNSTSGDPHTLNAHRGPDGWTVDGFGPFGSR